MHPQLGNVPGRRREDSGGLQVLNGRWLRWVAGSRVYPRHPDIFFLLPDLLCLQGGPFQVGQIQRPHSVPSLLWPGWLLSAFAPPS